MSAVTVYTCTFSDYDWSYDPQADTPGAQFVRFSDRPDPALKRWRHADLPDVPDAPDQRMRSRFPKIFPEKVLPDTDISVWIDGCILIRGDLTPLIEAFRASGKPIALFPHPSGRTVDEEITFAQARRLSPAQTAAAEAQRRSYAEAGTLDLPVTENSIIFRRHDAPGLARAMDLWWRELQTHTQRDQFSLPFVRDRAGLEAHLWDWHFTDDDNPYFLRYPHKPESGFMRLATAAHFFGDVDPRYALLHRMMRGIGWARRRAGLRRLAPRRAGRVSPPHSSR